MIALLLLLEDNSTTTDVLARRSDTGAPMTQTLTGARMVTALKKRPMAYLAELEAVHAQRDALARALRDVLKHCVDERQHMFAPQQKAMWRAQALLVEVDR
jgi:hypothetical protein